MARRMFSKCCCSWSLPIGSRSEGLSGLMNYGLSCCVNALLQSFSATWELVDLLEGWNPVDKESVPLYLRKVLLAMQSDQSQPAPHQDFLRCLDRNYICFHVQQDADEAQEIHSLYKVTMETYLQCLECTYIETGTSFLLSLPMHIRESHDSLEDCVRFFFKLQELRDGDKCYCEKCGEKKPFKQGFKLISLPPVLCLHLKRFRNSHGYTRKLHYKVTFPETLNISEILTAEALSERYVQSDSQYSLCAVIVHSGDAMFGHYTAYVRHKDQSWYYANDSYVWQVSWKEVQNTYGGSQREDTAYMLLYRRTPEGKQQEWSSG